MSVFFKNFYFLTGGVFLLWLLLLDTNGLIARYKISTKLRALKEAKVYYKNKIKKAKKDRDELMTNTKLLEKFAREKYLMKRDKEDVFIIQKEK